MDNIELVNNYLNNISNNKFGSKIVEKLGSGHNGEAYLTDKNFVVKITKDIAEVKTALNIIQHLNGVATPKYYDIRKLDNGLNIIVMEKVEPIKLSSSENGLLNMFRDKLLAFIKTGKPLQPLKDLLAGKLPIKMENILSGLIDAVDALKSIGIINADIHEDNLGFIGNKLKLLDVVSDKLVKEKVLK